MPGKRIWVLLLLQLNCYFSSGSCGKVLVWPMEYSPWINMKVILDELILRGHEITVVRPSSAIFVGSNESYSIKFETFPSSFNTDEYMGVFSQLTNLWAYELSRTTCLAYLPLLENLFMKFSDIWLNICKEAALNKELMARLRKARFDIVIADAIGLFGELLSELLEIPLLYTLRFHPGYTTEKYSGGLLVPPSYVPVMSGLSGQMTFMERVENFICMLYFDFWFETFKSKKWSNFYSEVLGHLTTLLEKMSRADIWLIRSYWDLEFPHPTLPSFDFVGGLHCKPAKPLPTEMEDFVQSSGDNGVVVFSLGSMIDNLTDDTANVIASALAQIPQKVRWEYVPFTASYYTLSLRSLMNNFIEIHLIVGHSKTKAFITHGGANGIYEAIHHGVPMVGIPLFGEQRDNIAHMVAKGAAAQLDIRTLSSKDLLRALETVINNPLCKKNAIWLSTIHHDQPMKPLDRAIFWIEFVMRNKGAKHLRPLAHNLTWYQYHSLDIIGFPLACVATVLFLVTKCWLLVYQMVVKMGKKKKRE
ncbi:UDP-glucuronosyltransferase 2B17-like isoform X2 [Perognathus longimembris pacificus]|uniref:UDP-glucuronosyltransferase 2B17-like isoform X2 n=1 Tax=Perognathus longimembris pacificus TaxID=214514 RepID=UPI002018B748|nr:UDP-glucuronosyltransferase 2B17-like isoform X2 [Perognathus longimembris pacificus]